MNSDAVRGPVVDRPARFRALAGRWSSRAGLLLVAALGGIAVAASGGTLVRAADDTGIFAFILGSFAQPQAAPLIQAPRYGSAGGRRSYAQSRGRRVSAEGRARSGNGGSWSRTGAATTRWSGEPAGRRSAQWQPAGSMVPPGSSRLAAYETRCVRTCDGYAFPVGLLYSMGHVPGHEAACRAACPGAETALYSMMPGVDRDDISKAVSVRDGTAYGLLKTAGLFRTGRVAGCSCQLPGNVAQHIPLMHDATLRAGDVVVDPTGTARVFAGSARLPHPAASFVETRASRAISRTAAAEVDRLTGAAQRQAALREWEKTRRTREASLRSASLAEVRPPAGSGAGVRVYEVRADAGRIDGTNARLIVLR